jgi:hypothetical protein
LTLAVVVGGGALASSGPIMAMGASCPASVLGTTSGSSAVAGASFGSLLLDYRINWISSVPTIG